MAEFRHRSGKSEDGEEGPWTEPGGEKNGEAASPEPWWRELVRDQNCGAEGECVGLIELVYAIADLRARAQEMGHDFLGYLLEMALHEGIDQLRASDPLAYPSPPAR